MNRPQKPIKELQSVALTGPVTGAIAWALVSYVPAFESGLPDPLQNAIAAIVGVVLGSLSGWVTQHFQRPSQAEE